MSPKGPQIRQLNVKTLTKSPRAPYTKNSMASQFKRKRAAGAEQGVQKKQSRDQVVKVLKTHRSVFLTPSSSETSISTASISSVVKPPAPVVSKLKVAPTPYLSLKRQPTAAILNFRSRKSQSQMDLKEVRRAGNYQLVAHVPSSSTALVPVNKKAGQVTFKDEGLAQMLLRDAAQLCGSEQSNVHFVVNGEQLDVRMASLRVFNTIMLRSWRRRREEVRHLSEQVEDFKRNFVKNRTQLHVFNTLFSVEKRRNETLNDQLKQSYMDRAKTKLSYNELNLLLDQVQKEKVKLIEENANKQQLNESMQKLLEDTKKELYNAGSEQRLQLEQLAVVEMEFQEAKINIEDLTRQLQSLQNEMSLKQSHIEDLSKNIFNVTKQLEDLSCIHQEYQDEAELEIRDLKKTVVQLQHDNEQKDVQILTLQNCLAATVGHRIRHCFAQSQPYHQATFRLLHLFAYCVLPGTPPSILPLASIPSAVRKLLGIRKKPTDVLQPELEDIQVKTIM